MNARQRYIVDNAPDHLRTFLENYDWDTFRRTWEQIDAKNVEKELPDP